MTCGRPGLVIQIVNQSTGQIEETCRTGSSCATAARLTQAGAQTYVARVSNPDGSSVQGQSAVLTVTWSAVQSPPPTATPPSPTPGSGLPLVQSGSWDVHYNFGSTTGNPPVDLGNHARRYEMTPDCAAIDACRIRTRTFEAGGPFVGNIVFTWHGDSFDYTGSANYYRSSGGRTCTTEGGDVIENAYVTREVVRLRPQRSVDGVVVEMDGTKVISGTPTAAGSAAGCEPYSLTYNAHLTA